MDVGFTRHIVGSFALALLLTAGCERAEEFDEPDAELFGDDEGDGSIGDAALQLALDAAAIIDSGTASGDAGADAAE